MQQKKRVLSPIPPRASYRPPATADVYSPVERAQFTMPNTVQYVEPHRKLHLSHHIAIGMLVMGVLCIIGVGIILPTWQNIQNQWTYGDARVAHASIGKDTDVYAYDVQGFLTVQVYIRGKQTTFTTPLSGQGRAIVTVQIFDVNDDGKVDIVVGIEGSNASFVLWGNGTGYQTTMQGK